MQCIVAETLFENGRCVARTNQIPWIRPDGIVNLFIFALLNILSEFHQLLTRRTTKIGHLFGNRCWWTSDYWRMRADRHTFSSCFCSIVRWVRCHWRCHIAVRRFRNLTTMNRKVFCVIVCFEYFQSWFPMSFQHLKCINFIIEDIWWFCLNEKRRNLYKMLHS